MSFRAVSELAGELGVIIAVEPLSPVETSFLSSCQEARRFITAVNQPACRLHLDIKAMTHETAGPVATIYEHRWEVEHFHGNDVNLRGPVRDQPTLNRSPKPLKRLIIRVGYLLSLLTTTSPEECAQLSLKNLQQAFSN